MYRIVIEIILSFMNGQEFFSIKIVRDNAIIIGCIAPVKRLIIPEKVLCYGKEYTIIEIADRAFYECTIIESVSIPATVMRIGREAFSRCNNLTEMWLEDGNISICYDDTEYDELRPPIKKLYIGRNIMLKDSSFSPFNSCPTLTHITIGDNVTFIGDSTFIDCANIKTIVFGKNLHYIGEGAFMNSMSIESIELPRHLLIIEKWAFSCCKQLSKVYLPQTTLIIDNAFEDCNNDLQLIYY